NPALPPEAFVAAVLEKGLTPIAHLTGKDGNRAFLEARLHALARMGVENVLCITGDAHKEGFQGAAKPVYDLDSVLILNLVQALREGIEYPIGPRTAKTTPFDFFAGAVVNPYKVREPDQMMQFYKLELKIASGAQYIITQLGYNLRKLYELKQYLQREGLDHVPIIPSVYVPTATIARFMREGSVAGCTIPDALLKALEGEKKPQRLERAALMVAAVKGLGFAGAHIGGFGLTHADFLTIIQRASEIGEGWRERLPELILTIPGEYYLFPEGKDGFSDATQPYQIGTALYELSIVQRLCCRINQMMIAEGSPGARFFSARLRDGADGAWRRGFWYNLLAAADLFKKSAFGCVQCGDCIADHLNYTLCSQGKCYKELRNGPCGGSRMDGTCEVDPQQPCVWNLAYLAALARHQNPRKFAETLVPPRDWSLNRTHSLANHYKHLDNARRRQQVSAKKPDPGENK
ncbi:MAG: methylenetetrahydrofolate reductase C-terminal domain-containing protein, partial [Armatimonadota bacterium]|nr:methylenetetrahydrofolate reductase C-terminal domain-containing protein [Armatimonadota bacterium]